MKDWTVAISLLYPHEAHLVKNVLEAEGFEVMIKDELTAQVNNFYSTAIGGVKLLVRQEDAERVHQVLIETGYIKDEEKEKVLEIFSKAYTQHCPYCGSEEVIRQKMPSYVVVFSILLVGIPLPFLKKTYHCFDCGKEWRVK